MNEVKSIEGETSLSLVMAGDNPEGSSRPEKRRKQSVVKGLRQQVEDGKQLRCSFVNVDPKPPPQGDHSEDGFVKPLRPEDLSRKRQLKGKLMDFINNHRIKTWLDVSPSLERKRSGELHWTTDDENIIHQGRIGGGGLGDVHRVRHF